MKLATKIILIIFLLQGLYVSYGFAKWESSGLDTLGIVNFFVYLYMVLLAIAEDEEVK